MSIVEHGDSMDVTIDGQLRTVPKCTCGKCIVRRLRGNNFPSFPYNKNMCSTYIDDYDWKTNVPEDPNSVYNRSKHNSFEGAYREHIPTSLISTAKMSFKPFKVKEEEKQKPKEKDLEVPLIGKSTYNRHYPSWGKLTPNDNTLQPREEINVPLRGVPNY